MKLTFSQRENLVIAVAWLLVYASTPLYMYYGLLAVKQPFMWHEVLISITGGMLGIVFGYIPAKKASSLDPIEAIRYE